MLVFVCLAPESKATVAASRFDNLPFRFEANCGQADPSIRYLARGPGYTLGLTQQGSALSLLSATVRTRLAHANPAAHLEPIDRQATETNYLRGDDPSKWLHNIASWSRIKYEQIYPGIDLVFYGAAHRVEYDFNVAPGADPSRIELDFSGARQIRLDPSGDLVLDTAAGEIRWQKPVVYQKDAAGRKPITGSFALKGRNRVGFRIGPYDHSRELVIDPTLAYATYLGGSRNEGTRAIAVDNTGAVYIAGFTSSTDFPSTAGSFQPAYAGGPAIPLAIRGDAFVAKLDPTGTKVIYNTYLGGRGDDGATGIAVDSAGEAVVTGYTNSNNFPTKNAYSPTYNGSGGNIYHTLGDAFLTKLNAAGNGLIYSTYFGGGGDDAATAVILDSTGAAYITGLTVSRNFPVTPGAVQAQYAGGGGNLTEFQWVPQPSVQTGDAFVAKFDANGALVFSTFFGGAKDDAAFAIALDASNNIYIAGATLSTNFPVSPAAYQSAFAGQGKLFDDEAYFVTGDAFIAKLDSTGSRKIYATYLGGSRDELATGIAVDSTGAAYVTGFTTSTNFPTTAGAYSRAYKGPPKLAEVRNTMTGDVFVTKLNPAGGLAFSTLIGDVDDEGGGAIALDPAGNIYVAGFTNSLNFPTLPGAVQTRFGDVAQTPAAPVGHAFLLELAPDGSKLLYSTLLGGSGNDRAFPGLALSPDGSAIIAGLTGSNDFPVSAAIQPRYGGADKSGDPRGDAWVAKISGFFPPVSTSPPPVTPPPVTPPAITITSIANGASLVAGMAAGAAVAPGEIIAIAGTNLGPAAPVMGAVDPASGLLSSSLGGVSVKFDGTAAPLVSVSATKAVAIVPYEIAGQTTTQMQLTFSGQTSAAAVALAVAPSQPGLFSADGSGSGQGLISNADSTPNSDSNPANGGDIITLNGTGEGQTNPPGVDGQIAQDMPAQPVLPVSVTIEGQDAPVMSYGVAPGQSAGYFQVTVQVPAGLDAGDQPVVLTVGSASSQPNLTVAVSGN